MTRATDSPGAVVPYTTAERVTVSDRAGAMHALCHYTTGSQLVISIAMHNASQAS